MVVQVLPLEATEEGQVVRQVEVAGEAIMLQIKLEAQEQEERCEYGPGDSNYSRAIWSGCAET